MPFTHATYNFLNYSIFLFKNQHFSTYLLCMITYNNISRAVHDPRETPTTSNPKSGVATPRTPRIDAYAYPHVDRFTQNIFSQMKQTPRKNFYTMFISF